MPFYKTIPLALLSGLLFAGAFPPVGQWWLAWLWALPLILLLWRKDDRSGWRRYLFGFRQGWMAGFFSFLGTLWWVGHVTMAGMPALCAYLALFPAVWGGFAALLRPRSPSQGFFAAISLAMLWAGLEWARSILLTGFPWNGAAVPLVEMPGLRSLAQYAGVTGLSFLPFFFMTGIAAVLVLRRHHQVRGRALLMVVCMSTPALVTVITWRQTPPPGSWVNVMLVQPNVTMADKMDPSFHEERYHGIVDLTFDGLDSAPAKPELIVWPESAIPYQFYSRANDEPLNAILEAGPHYLITGADALIPDESAPNGFVARNCSALLHGTRENFLLHAKMRLVPFGEFIPFRRELPFLEKMLGDLIPTDFTPGDSMEPQRMEGMKYDVIPLVCFEDTIARHARRFVRDTPQLMVNITNDNWFHESNESAIHNLNARWRCLELDRPMVRSSNTGVTCVIDPEGRVTSEVPRWRPAVIHAAVPLPPGGITFYAAHGDVIPIGFGIAGLLSILVLIRLYRHDS